MSAASLTLRHGFVDGDDEQRYLAALNTCFGAWGGRDRFDWCFRREGAGRRPDVLQLVSAHGPVAGSAVTYRTVHLGGGPRVVAGIMTGSWTLPDARGMGAFTRLIDASRETAAANGAALLLAFVTATNPSRRRLEAAGVGLVETWYCRSAGAAGVRDGHVRDLAAAGTAARLPSATTAGTTCFAYADDEWRDQFVNRPGDVRLVERPRTWTALVEAAPAFDRLLALVVAPGDWPTAIDALTARAAGAGRELFVFTTHAGEARALGARGFGITDGFLAVDVIDRPALDTACQSLVSPRDTTPRADTPASAQDWSWHLEHGDRM